MQENLSFLELHVKPVIDLTLILAVTNRASKIRIPSHGTLIPELAILLRKAFRVGLQLQHAK